MDQKFKIMRNSRRNIPDPISPQNPVIKKDVNHGENRVQDHLEEKTSVEEIYSDSEKERRDNRPNASNAHSSNLSTEENGV
jgi:hypothetical protein